MVVQKNAAGFNRVLWLLLPLTWNPLSQAGGPSDNQIILPWRVLTGVDNVPRSFVAKLKSWDSAPPCEKISPAKLREWRHGKEWSSAATMGYWVEEPVKDVLTTLSCPISSSPPFHALLIVFLPSDANPRQCALHYPGHPVHVIVLGDVCEHYSCSQKPVHSLCPALPVLPQSRCSQPAPKRRYFRDQELSFPPISHPGLLKGSRFASELHSLLTHAADLHLVVEEAKNILKLPGL